MKKILISLLLIFTIPVNLAKAEELPDITSDVEIRYKWYKEVIKGDYYPKREQLDGYFEDNSKIKYGNLSSWSEENCNLPNEYYMKEYDFYNIYKKVVNVRYIKLENFTFDNNIEIYQNNSKIDYLLISSDDNVVIDLKNGYFAETLSFHIKYEKDYKISLYREKYLNQVVLAKNVLRDELLIPDETWIVNTTPFETYYTSDVHKETGLTKKIKQYQVCRYREMYAYKYKIEKEYYDDNYHFNIDGYIKDINDYQIIYKGIPITNTIKITEEKIIKEPQIKYVYIQNEDNLKESDSSTKIDCPQQIQTKVEYLEKKEFKVPKKVYAIIILMSIIIIFLLVKLYKKYVA